MSALPLGLQLLVWAYALTAGTALTGCLALLIGGMARPRHRRPAEPLEAVRRAGRVVHTVWRDLVDGFASGAEWLIYGGRA